MAFDNKELSQLKGAILDVMEPFMREIQNNFKLFNKRFDLIERRLRLIERKIDLVEKRLGSIEYEMIQRVRKEDILKLEERVRKIEAKLRLTH